MRPTPPFPYDRLGQGIVLGFDFDSCCGRFHVRFYQAGFAEVVPYWEPPVADEAAGIAAPPTDNYHTDKRGLIRRDDIVLKTMPHRLPPAWFRSRHCAGNAAPSEAAPIDAASAETARIEAAQIEAALRELFADGLGAELGYRVRTKPGAHTGSGSTFASSGRQTAAIGADQVQDDRESLLPLPNSVGTVIHASGADVTLWWRIDGPSFFIEPGSWTLDGPPAGPAAIVPFEHNLEIPFERCLGSGEEQAGRIACATEPFHDQANKHFALRINPYLGNSALYLGVRHDIEHPISFARGDAGVFVQSLQDALKLAPRGFIEDASILGVEVQATSPLSRGHFSWQRRTHEPYDMAKKVDGLLIRIMEKAAPKGWTGIVCRDPCCIPFSQRGIKYKPIKVMIDAAEVSASDRMEALDRLERALEIYGVDEAEREYLLGD